MVHIKKGIFSMGSEGMGESESPIRSVEISDFLLDETPVTNEMFCQFVKETDHVTEAEKAGSALYYENNTYKLKTGVNWKTFFSKTRLHHPVVLISWHDASAYSKWANKRLPTEA